MLSDVWRFGRRELRGGSSATASPTLMAEKMKIEGRNTLWYSIGAATSIVIAAGLSDYRNPGGRGPTGPFGGLLLWIAYFLLAAFSFAVYRKLSTLFWRFKEEYRTHFLPLSLGLCYAPLFLGTWHLISRDGDPGQAFWLVIIVPVIFGFEGLRVASWIQQRQMLAESGSRDH